MPTYTGDNTKNTSQSRAFIRMHGKEMNTDIKSKEQIKEFVLFLIGLAPKIKSAADKGGVAITFGEFIWYVPHNYDPNIPHVEGLGKNTMTQCKTIEEAGFLCVAKWNQTYPDKKFVVPDTLTTVAEKFIPSLKNTYRLLGARPTVLKSFGSAITHLTTASFNKKIRTSSDDDISVSAEGGKHSPKIKRFKQ